MKKISSSFVKKCKEMISFWVKDIKLLLFVQEIEEIEYFQAKDFEFLVCFHRVGWEKTFPGGLSNSILS